MAKRENIIEENLKKYLEEINQICPIDLVILYGSYAKGIPSKESDIDLAVFSKKITECNRLKFMTQFLSRVWKYKLDFQPLAFSMADYKSDENDFIREEIKKKGKIIFRPS